MRYDISNIGERIRRVQKQNEVNQKDFAAKIGVNPNTLSQWIRGVQFPNLMAVLTICDVYNVRITELLRPVPEGYKPTRYKGGQNG